MFPQRTVDRLIPVRRNVSFSCMSVTLALSTEGSQDSAAAVPDTSMNRTSTIPTPTAPLANGTEEEDQKYNDDEVKLL